VAKQQLKLSVLFQNFITVVTYCLGRVHFLKLLAKRQLKLSLLLQNFITVVADCLGMGAFLDVQNNNWNCLLFQKLHNCCSTNCLGRANLLKFLTKQQLKFSAILQNFVTVVTDVSKFLIRLVLCYKRESVEKGFHPKHHLVQKGLKILKFFGSKFDLNERD